MLNYSGSTPHVSDADLVRFADGELPVRAVTATETHLRSCSKCRARLDELKHGAGAYDKYHAQLLRPSLDIPQEWSSVAARLRTANIPRERTHRVAILAWAAGVLLACSFVIVWLLHSQAPAGRMQQLLTRAALAPTPLHRRLEVMANGHAWYRPATLEGGSGEPDLDRPGLQETRALFVQANYSWDDPLSAKSFANWRKHLERKRDQVFSIEDRDGERRFFRLQTETPAGVLRMAALTLRADTLSPVKGAFYFEHQNDVTIEDAGEMPEPPDKREAKSDHPLTRPAVVREVGPAEELRVFAALDAIGADVGDSVTIDIAKSKHQIIVTGVGVPPDRQQQIHQALAAIPNTGTRFTSGQATAPVQRRPDSTSSQAPGTDAPLRHTLEQQAGGAQQFQAIADDALDASSVILQHAHALNVLADKFSPDVASQFREPEQETLRSLRRRHAIAIEKGTAELKSALLPLVRASAARDETQTQRNTSWQVGAVQLYEGAKALDASLAQILAGTYSQEAGQSIWSKLPDEIRRIETLAVAQQNSP